MHLIKEGKVEPGPGLAGWSDLTGTAGRTVGEAGIEGPAPMSADRLWDETHPSEASYLIASEARGQQSFQIVNVDLRILYRIGLFVAGIVSFALFLRMVKRLLLPSRRDDTSTPPANNRDGRNFDGPTLTAADGTDSNTQ